MAADRARQPVAARTTEPKQEVRRSLERTLPAPRHAWEWRPERRAPARRPRLVIRPPHWKRLCRQCPARRKNTLSPAQSVSRSAALSSVGPACRSGAGSGWPSPSPWWGRRQVEGRRFAARLPWRSAGARLATGQVFRVPVSPSEARSVSHMRAFRSLPRRRHSPTIQSVSPWYRSQRYLPSTPSSAKRVSCLPACHSFRLHSPPPGYTMPNNAGVVNCECQQKRTRRDGGRDSRCNFLAMTTW